MGEPSAPGSPFHLSLLVRANLARSLSVGYLSEARRGPPTPPPAMTAEDLLRAMCERNGLPASSGERLLPLVRRALQAPSDVRNRILTLVENNLIKKAQDQLDSKRLWNEMDNAVLVAVARVLHDWDPSSSVLELGRRLEGFDPKDDAA